MASPFKPEWDAKGVKVHESAYIDDPDMKIGAGTRIWHFSHILPGVEIGKNSTNWPERRGGAARQGWRALQGPEQRLALRGR